MIGQSDDLPFVSLDTLFSRDELREHLACETASTPNGSLEEELEPMIRTGRIMRVYLNDEPLFFIPSSLDLSPVSPVPPGKRPRMVHKFDPRLRALNSQLTAAQDRLRKLKLLQRGRTEHAELPQLVDKWRAACGWVLEEVKLRSREMGGDMGQLRSRKILQSLGVEWESVGLELSSDDSEPEEDSDDAQDAEQSPFDDDEA